MGHKKIILKLLELAQELDKTDKAIECSMIVNDMEKLIDSYVSKILHSGSNSVRQEIERRRDLIISEPNGKVREQMISDLALDF